MPHVDRLTVYPVKALAGADRQSVTISQGGTLDGDREFAIRDAEGEIVNGKRTSRLTRIDASVEPETGELRCRTPEPVEFDLRSEPDRQAAAAWLGVQLDRTVTIDRDGTDGFPDRPALGPSIISTGTIEAIASWYEDLTPESVRRRFRANIEIGGVPPFWEDRLISADGATTTAGPIKLVDAQPCGRCVVPTRDPDTGESIPQFRDRFVRRRRETLPEWTDETALDHFYSAMVIARIPQSHRGKSITVGNSVRIHPNETA